MREQEIVKLRFGDWSEGGYYSVTISSDNPDFRAGDLARALKELSEKYNSFSDFFHEKKLSSRYHQRFSDCGFDLTVELSSEQIATLFISLINQEYPLLQIKRTKDVRRVVLDTCFASNTLIV